jgi:hypothetical protein
MMIARISPSRAPIGRARAFALLEHREQEEHRFQTFTGDSEKDHGDQCDDLMFRSRSARASSDLQRMLDRTRHFAHPEHHRTENTHGHQADDAFEQLLLLLREFGTDQFQTTADQQGECSGEETRRSTRRASIDHDRSVAGSWR